MRPDDDPATSHPAAHDTRPTPSAPSGGPGPAGITWPAAAEPAAVVQYGPDVPDETTLRLLGTIEGKRILELGVGNGANAVALARAGAKVITVDPSAVRLDAARRLAEEAEVRIELHEGDLADFSFVRADGIDLVLSVYALAQEPDADRVFRQAHRVLRPECSLVISVPHPAANVIDPSAADASRVVRSYFDRAPRPWPEGRAAGIEQPRTFGDLVGGLYRANFRVESVIEPEPGDGARSAWWSDVHRLVPPTLVIRARKLGI